MRTWIALIPDSLNDIDLNKRLVILGISFTIDPIIHSFNEQPLMRRDHFCVGSINILEGEINLPWYTCSE